MEQLRAQAQAYQTLLGFQQLPRNGQQAQQAATQLAAIVLAAAPPPSPALSTLIEQQVGENASGCVSTRPPKQRFQDVATGMRLRCLDWGGGSGNADDDVVLLLHDLGEAAEVWGPVAACLRGHGYHAMALDLRGHGGSSGSVESRYSAGVMAEDIKAFITAADLYVRPVAVVGAGAGGAVALALAQQWPRLVGALVLLDFTLPAAVQAEAGRASRAGEAAGPGQPAHPDIVAPPSASSKPSQGEDSSSLMLLPWWSLHPAQAAAFYCAEECAAFLCHPLANLSPAALLPMAAAVKAAAVAGAQGAAQTEGSSGQQGAQQSGSAVEEQASAAGAQEQRASATEADIEESEEQPSLSTLLASLSRPVKGAVRSACSMLPPPARAGWGSAWPAGEGPAAGGMWPTRTDQRMLFSFEPLAMATGMRALTCHLLLVTGSVAAGSWSPAEDAAAMAAAASGAASAATAAIPAGGHRLATDQAEAVAAEVLRFLEGPAVLSFQPQPQQAQQATQLQAGSGTAAAGGSQGSRLPELLGLRPLPQYASLEEAQKALGPRAIPTRAAVEAELAKLRLEEGRDLGQGSSDEGDDSEGGEGGTGEADEQDGCVVGRLELGGTAAGEQARQLARLRRQAKRQEREARRYQTALANNPADYFGFVG